MLSEISHASEEPFRSDVLLDGPLPLLAEFVPLGQGLLIFDLFLLVLHLLQNFSLLNSGIQGESLKLLLGVSHLMPLFESFLVLRKHVF